jgi:hypothetical protein
VHALHVAIALAVALPLASIIAAPTLSHPRGDAILFEPGALYLGEALRLGFRPFANALAGSVWIVILASYLGLLPLGALVSALNRRGPVRLPDLLADAAPLFGPFSLLLGLSVAALAFSTVFLILFAIALPLPPSGRSADLAHVAVALAGALLFAFVGLLHDVARASAVRHGLRGLSALSEGAYVLRRRAPTAVLGFTWRAAIGAALVAGGAVFSGAVSVERWTGWSAVLLVHQGIALSLLALRASWLACALRLVATTD